MTRAILTAALLMLTSSPISASPPDSARSAAIEAYVQPYVRTNNFSGVVLVARSGKPIFAKAYGRADSERAIPNSLGTRFHIASMSMQFTAAAVLRLVDKGELSLETPVANVLSDYPNGQNITIRHLLAQTSGIADINARDDYDELLGAHQTPASLVARMRGAAPLRPPGTYEREEHSAYNLLALIVERKSGLPFAEAVRQLVFGPLGMNDSGIDDDGIVARACAARGYEPRGLYDLAPARPIHWSAKAGNGSAYTTAGDELKFVTGVVGERFLSAPLRDAMFDLGSRVGYGWFKSNSSRFGETVYSMNGRAPGFSSAIAYFPQHRLLIVALSNIYASVPADMAYDIAAAVLDKPYRPLALDTATDPEALAGLPAKFRFPHDFYQPDAVVQWSATQGEVQLHWPSGESSSLIPIGKNRFIDRSYWVAVEIERDAEGRATALKYDRFSGQRSDVVSSE